jgi:hypothetical protein
MTKRNLKVFCDKNDQSNSDVSFAFLTTNPNKQKNQLNWSNLKAKVSCDYFNIECTGMFFGLDRCSIMLKANLDSSKKSNYVVTMKAVSVFAFSQ